MIFIISILAGRFLGFSPKQLNPIPWMELFENKLVFISIFSAVLSLLFVFLKDKLKN